MSIHVKCFASLRQQLGVATTELTHHEAMTVADVWQALTTLPPPTSLLCARNQEYTNFTQTVLDGDEIAFFPPVTGG